MTSDRGNVLWKQDYTEPERRLQAE